MPILRSMKGVPTNHLVAEGLFSHDLEALLPYQRAAVSRFCMTLKLEQEAYMTAHPEVIAFLEIIMGHLVSRNKVNCDFLKEAALYAMTPGEDLENEIRKRLNLGENDDFSKNTEPFVVQDDEQLVIDIGKTMEQFNPAPLWSARETPVSTPTTLSSSFRTRSTSATTLPTPEPEPIPEMTIYEFCFTEILEPTLERVAYFHMTRQQLNYDMCYIEVMSAVEKSMEMPVILIREDISEFLEIVLIKLFKIIDEKIRVAEKLLWESRMRKKMKKTLRGHTNFTGYDSRPLSEISFHSASQKTYKVPLLPCECFPQRHYNRYPKDRFGIYMPREEKFNDKNVTVTPAGSISSIVADEDSLTDEEPQEEIDEIED